MRFAAAGLAGIIFSACGGLPDGFSLSKLKGEVVQESEHYASCPSPDEGWCVFFDDGSQISIRVDADLIGTLDAGPIQVPIEGTADEYGYVFHLCGLNQSNVGTLAFPIGENNLSTATLAVGDTSVLGTVMTPEESFMPYLQPSVTGLWSATQDTQPVDAEIKISQHANLLLLSVLGNQGPDLLWNAHPTEQGNDCPLIGGNLQDRVFEFAEPGTAGSMLTGEFNFERTAAEAVRDYAGGATAQSITLQRKL